MLAPGLQETGEVERDRTQSGVLVEHCFGALIIWRLLRGRERAYAEAA